MESSIRLLSGLSQVRSLHGVFDDYTPTHALKTMTSKTFLEARISNPALLKRIDKFRYNLAPGDEEEFISLLAQVYLQGLDGPSDPDKT